MNQPSTQCFPHCINFQPISLFSSQISHQITVLVPQCLCSSHHYSSTMLSHNAYVTHLISLHHLTPSQEGWVQYLKILRETDHIQITFTTAYCYNFYFIVVNLLLCQVYKLNYHSFVCIRKYRVHVEFDTIYGFRHPLGVLEYIPRGQVWLQYLLFRRRLRTKRINNISGTLSKKKCQNFAQKIPPGD